MLENAVYYHSFSEGGQPMAEQELRTIDLSGILRDYTDCWVALSSDQSRVVGSGSTPKEALQQAQQRGEQNPILMPVPSVSGPYEGA